MPREGIEPSRSCLHGFLRPTRLPIPPPRLINVSDYITSILLFPSNLGIVLEMEILQDILQKSFAVDSIWSIVTRGLIWLGVAMVVIVSMDKPDPDKSLKDLKSNLGFFLFFTVITGGLIYMLFGFTAA